MYLIADNMMNVYEFLESIQIQFGSNFVERFPRHSANWPMLETRKLKYVHYTPLMMSQKVAHRKHTCVLHKKVAGLV